MALLEFRLEHTTLPQRVGSARRRFALAARTALHSEFVEEAPYQHIKDSVYARGGDDEISVGYASTDARAQNQGAYIKPKAKRVLKFADGSFRPYARLKPKRFFDRACDRAPETLAATFRLIYGRLL